MTVRVEFMSQEWFQQDHGERIDGKEFTIPAGQNKHFGGPGSVSLIISCNETDDGGTLKLFQGTHFIRRWDGIRKNIRPEPIVINIENDGFCEIRTTERVAVIGHSQQPRG